jgi:hypothetical protein
MKHTFALGLIFLAQNALAKNTTSVTDIELSPKCLKVADYLTGKVSLGSYKTPDADAIKTSIKEGENDYLFISRGQKSINDKSSPKYASFTFFEGGDGNSHFRIVESDSGVNKEYNFSFQGDSCDELVEMSSSYSAPDEKSIGETWNGSDCSKDKHKKIGSNKEKGLMMRGFLVESCHSFKQFDALPKEYNYPQAGGKAGSAPAAPATNQ